MLIINSAFIYLHLLSLIFIYGSSTISIDKKLNINFYNIIKLYRFVFGFDILSFCCSILFLHILTNRSVKIEMDIMIDTLKNKEKTNKNKNDITRIKKDISDYINLHYGMARQSIFYYLLLSLIFKICLLIYVNFYQYNNNIFPIDQT